VAWSLLTTEEQAKIYADLTTPCHQGIHIHCPDGSINKDGPSAGVAITLAIYSRFLNIPIPNTVGFTGEIDLYGNVSAIGGLEAKIMGSYRSGIRKIVYPAANQNDVDAVSKKFPEIEVEYVPISHIRDLVDKTMKKI